MTNKNKVFVVNKGGHDFTGALHFGEIVYLSEGSLNRYAVTNMYRQFAPFLSESMPNDYILITGLTTMACVACSMFAHIHGRLNLLLFKSGKYAERKIVLDELLNGKPFTDFEEMEEADRVKNIIEENGITNLMLETYIRSNNEQKENS
tara:strand:- start:5103 stop:5549 length:447 start_codon:yes stop_codon:yes gene_type:complete